MGKKLEKNCFFTFFAHFPNVYLFVSSLFSLFLPFSPLVSLFPSLFENLTLNSLWITPPTKSSNFCVTASSIKTDMFSLIFISSLLPFFLSFLNPLLSLFHSYSPFYDFLLFISISLFLWGFFLFNFLISFFLSSEVWWGQIDLDIDAMLQFFFVFSFSVFLSKIRKKKNDRKETRKGQKN